MQQLIASEGEFVVGKVPKVDCIIKGILDEEMVASLRASGFDIQARCGHSIIEAQPQYLPPRYDFLRRKVMAEEGGAETSFGSATIYTDLIGNKLRHFRIVSTGAYRNSYGHVKLALDFKAVVVTAEGPRNAWKEVVVSVETVDAVTFEVRRKVLWKGCRLYVDKLDAVLPPRMEKYRVAIVAAMLKADDVYRRRTFFYVRDEVCA
jgi:hypothetical protein